MSRRKGKKPPKPNPKDCYAPKLDAARSVNGKKVKASRWFYTDKEKTKLRERLRRILSTEAMIPEIIDAMERAFIAPDMVQLKRKLKRAQIYPPPVDDRADAHKICFGPCCGGRRSHPAYYVKSGLDYEARQSRLQVDADSLTAAEADDAEEIDRLRGDSPGVLIDMQNQLENRKGRRDRAA